MFEEDANDVRSPKDIINVLDVDVHEAIKRREETKRKRDRKEEDKTKREERDRKIKGNAEEERLEREEAERWTKEVEAKKEESGTS